VWVCCIWFVYGLLCICFVFVIARLFVLLLVVVSCWAFDLSIMLGLVLVFCTCGYFVGLLRVQVVVYCSFDFVCLWFWDFGVCIVALCVCDIW